MSSAPSLAAGTQWDAKIPMRSWTARTSTSPCARALASLAGERVVIQATGSHGASMTYQGFTVPLEFTVALASSFNGGKFERIDYSVDEVVHAGPQTQDMHWTASLEAR